VSFETPSRNRCVGPLTLGGLALMLGSAAALPCHAAGRCHLEVTGTSNPAWRDAIGSVDARSTDAGDCALIRLSVAGETARLTFETNDGRVAERELRHPSELTPTLDALLVTGLPPETETETETEFDAESATDTETDAVSMVRPATSRPLRAPRRGAAIVTEADTATRTPGADALTAAFSLQLGARGGADGLMSAVIHGQVTMDRSRWEIGVWGAFEPEYGPLAGDAKASEPAIVQMAMPPSENRLVEPVGPPGPASAGVVGVTVGRRVPFTHLDVIVGARVGVAAIRHFGGADDGAEIRVGSGADFVFPRASTLRFRTGLGAEVVPDGVNRAGAGPMPWWALVARLGIEVGGR
jgi:hypothetical protein